VDSIVIILRSFFIFFLPGRLDVTSKLINVRQELMHQFEKVKKGDLMKAELEVTIPFLRLKKYFPQIKRDNLI